MDSVDPIIGRVLSERYRVIDQLGRGGMGAVYRAEHVHMKKEVAVKVLHAELGVHEEVARRFEREAQSASRLAHPNIIQVTDFGRDGGTLFLVMELLHGESLTALIERGRVPPPRAAAIMAQVLDALAHAHAQGVVHRDLKPDNVFLARRDGEEGVKLLDFGIAKMAALDGKSEALTQAGVVFGTPEYLSPEQALGEPADGRADLYAAGVMLFELLAGRRPFVADTKVGLISMHLTQAPPSLREACPEAEAPPALERVVARALAKKRDQRYPSAQAFRDELGAALAAGGGGGGRALGAVREQSRAVAHAVSRAFSTASERVARAGVPRPRLVVASATLVAGASLLLLGALAVHHRAPPRPAPPPPAQAGELARAEELLGRGDLPAARAALQQQLSAHPEVARVHYLLGNLHFAEKERAQALSDYRDAIRLDPGYRGDPTLLANGRTMLDEKSTADLALGLLTEDVGAPAARLLADCARACREPRVRRAAGNAAVKLGGGEVTADTDLARLVDDLETGKSCKDRRRAVEDLRALGDPRAVDPLRKARERRGGFFGVQRVNACIARDLDEAIRALGGNP